MMFFVDIIRGVVFSQRLCVCFVVILLSIWPLAIVLEDLLKSLTREEDAALDRSERKIHLFGDFIVLEARHVHREGDAILVGERVDGSGDFFCGNRTFGGVEPGILREIQVVQVLCTVDDCCRTHYLAIIVDEDITHDSEHPSLKVYIVDIFILVVERLYGGVLKQIVCIITVRREDVGEVQKVLLEA